MIHVVVPSGPARLIAAGSDARCLRTLPGDAQRARSCYGSRALPKGCSRGRRC